MNIEFPHLDDTKFPGVNNEETLSGVDVYKYENNFDYYRWKGQISVKLLNVLWNSNYADVPYFDSDSKRDEWFDNQSGIIQPLLSPFNSTPETYIQLPIPYNDAFKYNYVVVDMPLQTSDNQPLDYENADARVKRWYYFIQDIEQLSPNTTRFEINVDYWTTFIHSVQINYLMLERGHAPMTKTTVDQYLNNPLANSEYLLADDFNYQRGETVIQSSNYTPIGNGKKYVLFAAPYAQSDFALFGGVDYSGESTPPSYEDYSGTNSHYNRWMAGNQYVVNDYEWKYGDVDYRNARLPIRGLLGQDNEVFNGNYCYAIDAIEASAFFNRMAHTRVQFIHGIQALFILDESMFERGDSFTFENATIYRCRKRINTLNYTLVKEAFNFDENYKEITKLYTSPYSFIEITDDNGNSFNFNIENTGRIQMHSEVSLAFPWLRYNVFFTGINGDGSFNYTWKNLNDNDVNKTMWESDFSKFMMNWDIPTYSIYISSENEYAANNAAGMNARRLGAIKDYQNATRFAATNRENMAASMQTNTDNVAATGQANIANTNTQNTANTDITKENNGMRTDITDENNDMREDIRTDQNITDGQAFGFANDLLRDNTVLDNNMVTVKTDIENENATIGFAANAVGSIATGFMQGGAAGAIMSGVSAIPTGVATAVGVTNNLEEANAIKSTNSDKVNNTITYNLRMLGGTDGQHGSLGLRRSIQERTNDAATENTKRQNLAAKNNTDTQNAADAAKIKKTTDTNNDNALRTQTTETNNATETRYANIQANKANLRQAQIEAEAQYKNARLQRPAKQGEYNNDAYPDIWMRRGFRFNIHTQTKAAIKQTGDAFLRFGYALHRVWDMSQGFNYMKYFTFWKAEDIWVNDGTGVANIATNTISDILLKGVTVWSDPTKIGMVSIYDNMRGGN